MMRSRAVAAVCLVLIAGCATAPPANPYTDLTVERARATCLARNAVWCETREHAICRPKDSEPTAKR